jgi:hypothetical protein
MTFYVLGTVGQSPQRHSKMLLSGYGASSDTAHAPQYIAEALEEDGLCAN